MVNVKPVKVGKNTRMSFSKINEVLDMPNLIEIQKNSYNWFLEQGLREVFRDVSGITDFSGNLVLKYTEGLAGTLMGIIKQEMMADLRGKIGGLIAKPAFRRVKKVMDYTEVGGAPLLGVRGAVVKAHGSSNAHAIACAIRQAALMKRRGLVDAIEKEITKQLKED